VQRLTTEVQKVLKLITKLEWWCES